SDHCIDLDSVFFLCFVFFFFQAEDGIRDRNVTGVQTCALPISTWTCTSPSSPPTSSTANETVKNVSDNFASFSFVPKYFFRFLRSEERRVGKECRSRWSACD